MPHRRLRLFLWGWLLILFGGALAYAVQAGSGVRMQTLGADMLYLPPGASTAHRLPGVVIVPDGRASVGGLGWELARHGYVALVQGADGDGLARLRALAMVDAGAIGLLGIGVGGAAVLRAAEATPDGYRAVVLLGAGLERGGLGPDFPRNIAVIYGDSDEFARRAWGVARASEMTRSPVLARLFGIRAEAAPGRVYGTVADGRGRMLLMPAMTHAFAGFSRAAVAGSVAWFMRCLPGGLPVDPFNQIWLWPQLGGGIALAGVLTMLLGGFELLLTLPGFEMLDGLPDSAAARRTMTWWTGWGLASWVPVLGYFAFLDLGAVYLPAGAVFQQPVTNQILGWLALSAGLNLALTLALRGDQADAYGSPLLALASALVMAAAGYGVVAALAAVGVTPAVLGLGLRALDGREWGQMLAYLPGFTLSLVLILHNLHARLSVYADDPITHYLSNIGAVCAGMAVFLAVQYGWLFATGHVLSPDQPEAVVLATRLLPLQVVLAVVATFTWRRTGNVLPGAFMCGGLATWFLVGL